MTLLSEHRYYTIADNIVYDWYNNHTAKEIEETQAFYDCFLSDDADKGKNRDGVY